MIARGCSLLSAPPSMAPAAPVRCAGAVTLVADRGRCGRIAAGTVRSDRLPPGQGGPGPLLAAHHHGLAARRRDLSARGGRPAVAAHPADGLPQVSVLDEAPRSHLLEDLAPSLPVLLHPGYLVERQRLRRGGWPRAPLGIENGEGALLVPRREALA